MEGVFISVGFRNIVQGRARAVRVHITDLIDAASRHLQGALDASCQPNAVLLRCCRVRCIVGHCPAPQYGQNPCAALLSMSQSLQHQNCCAFSQIQPFAVLVEGPARLQVQRLKRIEPAQGERAQRVAAPGENHRSSLIQQHIGSQCNGHCTRSARHRNGAGWPQNAQMLSHRSGHPRH